MAKNRWQASVSTGDLGNVGLTLEANTVVGKLQKLYYGTRRGSVQLQQVMEDIARIAEQYAKANHRWTNRTGDAERGITGTADWESDTRVAMTLSHTVDYGVYLELAFQKRYAILEESTEYAAAFLGDRLKGGIDVVIK